MKLKEIRWAGHVARTGGEQRWIPKFDGGNLSERVNLEDLIIEERIILNLISGKLFVHDLD